MRLTLIMGEGLSAQSTHRSERIEDRDVPTFVMSAMGRNKIFGKNDSGGKRSWWKASHEHAGVRLDAIERVVHSDGLETYVATWVLPNGARPGVTDHYIEFVDVRDGKIVGMGQIADFKLQPQKPKPVDMVLNTPHISIVQNEEAFAGQGYGERRYILMNEFCKQHFGKPLASGNNTSAGAKKIWKSLVSKGLAREVHARDWPQIGDYVFID